VVWSEEDLAIRAEACGYLCKQNYLLINKAVSSESNNYYCVQNRAHYCPVSIVAMGRCIETRGLISEPQ